MNGIHNLKVYKELTSYEKWDCTMTDSILIRNTFTDLVSNSFVPQNVALTNFTAKLTMQRFVASKLHLPSLELFLINMESVYILGYLPLNLTSKFINRIKKCTYRWEFIRINLIWVRLISSIILFYSRFHHRQDCSPLCSAEGRQDFW